MAGKIYGAYMGTVANTADPTNNGRVQVRIPTVAAGTSSWAPVCQPFGGASGAPRIGNIVVVVFHEGDPGSPIVIGTIP